MSRKNVSLTKPIEDRAAEIIAERGFTGLSDMFATLVREEFERRGLKLEETQGEPTTPAKPTGKPVSYRKGAARKKPGSKLSKAEQDILDIIKTGDEKSGPSQKSR